MITHTTLDVRRSDQRGRTELGWLHSRHSFSFGHYRDPQRMSFRSLRVLNDDIVEPGGGFGEHGHADMEIISWPLAGALAHWDSTGTREVVRPGDAQVMSAGQGIRHSEMNDSDSERAHFLQIWIEPTARGLEPAYGQQTFDAAGRRNRWQLIVSPDGRDASMAIHQDALMLVADLDAGASVEAVVADGRAGYLHVATGRVQVGELTLDAGDAVALDGAVSLAVKGIDASEVLFFDLA